MIVTCLNGGLGNQMFQYAVARSLADRSGESLWLDVRDLFDHQRSGAVHCFRLGAYAIRAKSAGSLELISRGFFRSRKVRRILGDHGWRGTVYIREKGFSFQPIRIVPGGFNYLEGYWQSWRYFEDDRAKILEDLTLQKKAVGKNSELLSRITKGNSVCLHVRLGDYVSSSGVSAVHGNLDAGYYRAATEKMKKLGKKPVFYLFSDEPGQAVRFLGRNLKVEVVDHNQGAPEEDLRLMGACKYFVTANSSFSWWGAWLSQRPGKKVIAPKKWFATPEKDTRDLIPGDWLRI